MEIFLYSLEFSYEYSPVDLVSISFVSFFKKIYMEKVGVFCLFKFVKSQVLFLSSVTRCNFL